jgi:hypothetical protein
MFKNLLLKGQNIYSSEYVLLTSHNATVAHLCVAHLCEAPPQNWTFGTMEMVYFSI